MSNTISLKPYLFFDGKCEEAIAFYQHAVGAKVNFQMRFKDSPEPPAEHLAPPPHAIMHAELDIAGNIVLVSDGRCTGHPKFDGFGLALGVHSEADADRLYNGLAHGGKPIVPLAKTFFSPRFGMVADKFGVTWMVMVQPSERPPMKH